jgi:hypothetical protein
MSNYHVLKQTELRHKVVVAFHIPVPVETNEAGRLLSDCIKEDQSPETKVPWLNPTEATAIQNGEVYEHVVTVDFENATFTPTVKAAQLDTKWTSLQTKIQSRIRNTYQWWGTDRDIS